MTAPAGDNERSSTRLFLLPFSRRLFTAWPTHPVAPQCNLTLWG